MKLQTLYRLVDAISSFLYLAGELRGINFSLVFLYRVQTSDASFESCRLKLVLCQRIKKLPPLTLDLGVKAVVLSPTSYLTA